MESHTVFVVPIQNTESGPEKLNKFFSKTAERLVRKGKTDYATL